MRNMEYHSIQKQEHLYKSSLELCQHYEGNTANSIGLSLKHLYKHTTEDVVKQCFPLITSKDQRLYLCLYTETLCSMPSVYTRRTPLNTGVGSHRQCTLPVCDQAPCLVGLPHQRPSHLHIYPTSVLGETTQFNQALLKEKSSPH